MTKARTKRGSEAELTKAPQRPQKPRDGPLFENRIRYRQIYCSGLPFRESRSEAFTGLASAAGVIARGLPCDAAGTPRFVCEAGNWHGLRLSAMRGHNKINLGGASKPRPGPSTFAPSVAAPQAQNVRSPLSGSGRSLFDCHAGRISPAAAGAQVSRAPAHPA